MAGQLAGLGFRLRLLLETAGLSRSTYYYYLSRPAHVTRPDLEDAVERICARTPNGYRQVLTCLRAAENGVAVSGKSVLAVMRRLGTGVTEFKVAGGKAYLAPVYDIYTKRIVAWDVSRYPVFCQVNLYGGGSMSRI